MTAFNVVRFRVKPGREQDFIEGHKSFQRPEGARRFVLIKTGDSTFCAVGEWESFDHIVAARPMMVGLLDGFREMLEEMGELGVTDPVSGEAVVEIGPPVAAAAPAARARRAAGGARRKPANKARATSPRRGKAPAKAKAKPKAKASKKAAPRKAAKKPARKAAKRGKR